MVQIVLLNQSAVVPSEPVTRTERARRARYQLGARSLALRVRIR